MVKMFEMDYLLYQENSPKEIKCLRPGATWLGNWRDGILELMLRLLAFASYVGSRVFVLMSAEQVWFSVATESTHLHSRAASHMHYRGKSFYADIWIVSLPKKKP